MRHNSHLILTICLLIAPALAPQAVAEVEEVVFLAADGAQVHGDLYWAAEGRKSPLILLFHQAGGDARGEYEAIIPRLVDNDYSVLAVDQRSGGGRFGGVNRTVAGLGGEDFTYCDAYVDLEAAVAYTTELGVTGATFAWGSSYSAGLAFQLGVEHADDLDGILAFSPASGGPMAACSPNDFIPQLGIPALAMRPRSEMEVESVREQFETFEQHGIRTHVAEHGVHGSSMLVEERTGSAVASTWDVVLDFLAGVARE